MLPRNLLLLVALAILPQCSEPGQQVGTCLSSQELGTQAIIDARTIMLGDDVYPEEGPRRVVNVPAFAIDRYEVTNSQFAHFVAATGYVTQAERGLADSERPELPPEVRGPGSAVFRADRPEVGWQFVGGASWRNPLGPGSSLKGRENYPVVHVSLADARSYANWAGRALPDEAQWEAAARDGNQTDGPQAPPATANTWQGVFPVRDTGADGYVGLAPVGCFDPNEHGAHDMLGNVWEWVEGSEDQRKGLIKGGSHLCAQNYCMRYRAGARQFQEADFSSSHIGFRTVSAPSGKATDKGSRKGR